jgi:hypothetical protein
VACTGWGTPGPGAGSGSAGTSATTFAGGVTCSASGLGTGLGAAASATLLAEELCTSSLAFRCGALACKQGKGNPKRLLMINGVNPWHHQARED